MYFNQQEVAGVTDAIIDTGTSLIIGDNRTVQAFYDKIPGSALNDSTGIYQSMDPGIRQLSIQLTHFYQFPAHSMTQSHSSSVLRTSLFRLILVPYLKTQPPASAALSEGLVSTRFHLSHTVSHQL